MNSPREGEIPSGFRFAGRMTIAFDGGNHPLKGDIWSCRSCAALVFPGDKDVHERFHALVDGLLDEANQVAAVSPPDAGECRHGATGWCGTCLHDHYIATGEVPDGG